jgi:membrane fusion protein, multidrug efflux system
VDASRFMLESPGSNGHGFQITTMNRQTPIDDLERSDDLEKSPPVLPDKRPPGAPPIPEPPATVRQPSKSGGKAWLWWLVIAVAAASAIYYEWPRIKPLLSTETQTPAAGKQRKGTGGNISVVAAKAQRGDIGVYYTALGAVTPIYTVTLKSRVDGELMKVMFQEGQVVKQGDPLIEIDVRPYQAALEQAQGALARDQALLKNSLVDLDRYKTLLAQDAIPQQQWATQDALVDQYRGTVKLDEAAVDTAKINVVYCHIASPINGLVGLRLVDPGNIVHATDTNGLVVITQIDPISVIFTLAEDQLPAVLDKLHAGEHLTVEAWDRDLKAKLAMGTLQTIDNEIDPTTGTLKLRANFDNHLGKLFPSQFVNARLLIEEKHGITLVPSAAIQRNAQSTYVWLVKPDRTVTARPVTVGVSEGEQTQITNGLQPGDTVVTVGVDRLQDGSKVNVEISGEKTRNKT